MNQNKALEDILGKEEDKAVDTSDLPISAEPNNSFYKKISTNALPVQADGE